MPSLQQTDPQVSELLRQEAQRQASTVELIASENHVSAAVLEAAGSVMTNKYAEGYPGARYYGGCQYYDQVETLAIDRAKQMFGCRFANVQSHSGANANLAAFMAMMQPGDRFIALNLSSGGHLRDLLQAGVLRAGPEDRDDRLQLRPGQGEGTAAEDDPLRLQRLPADDRF